MHTNKDLPYFATSREIRMNQEKLKLMQAQVRMGGKGTVRRKKRVVHRTATTDDKMLQSSLQKLSVNMVRMEERRYKEFEELDMLNTDRDFARRHITIQVEQDSDHHKVPCPLLRGGCKQGEFKAFAQQWSL